MAHDGGGGGGAVVGDGVVVDHGVLRSVTSRMTDAGGTFDEVAASMPTTGGTGVAEALVATMLAELSTAAADVITESDALAEAADACNVRYQDSDAVAAERFLVSGETGSAS